MSRSIFLRASMVAVYAALAHSAGVFAQAVDIRFLSPQAAEPAFGDIEVSLSIDSPEAIASVELFVDGLPSGRRTTPPYVFRVSLGDENLAHRFRADVVTLSGLEASTSIMTSAIRVDEVVDFSLQQVYVTVTNRNGRRVLDLDQRAFRLFDDGRPQSIVTFAAGDIPFSAMILIDGSASMQGPKIKAARAGARSFLAGMRDFDEAKVVVFSTRLLAASDFGGPAEPLSELVEKVDPEGGTALNDFLFLGLRQLEGRQGRRVLVLLSDGWDIHSVLRMEQVVGIARQSQAQIYWLQLEERRSLQVERINSWRDPDTNRKQFRQLRKVIAESGGRQIRVDSPAEIETSFQQVLSELREQYALGYYPDSRHDDGRWRRIQVDVDGPYKLKAREGYLDLP